MHASHDEVTRAGARRARRATAALFALVVAAVGCATPADLRKLQNRVTDLERAGSAPGSGRDRVAEMGAEIAELKQSVDALSGRLEVMERQVQLAAEDARAARSEANGAGAPAAPTDAAGAAAGAAPGGAAVS